MSFQIKFFKMVIVMMVITGSFSMPAFVQADEFEPPPTASAPNASVMPIPANPRTWCEEEGYCSPGETTTTVVIDDDPPPPTAWRIVVNGRLSGGRRTSSVQTSFGEAEYGIGGIDVCPEGTIGLVVSAGSLRHLRAAAGRRLLRGVFCASPNGSVRQGDTVNVPGLDQYITVVVFEELVARLERDERALWLHMCSANYPNVIFEEWFNATPEGRNELCPDVDPAQQRQIDDNLETNYRFECADKMDVVTFQEWEAATPARRVELCPPSAGGSSVGEFLSQNVDFQVDVNLCAGQSGLESSLVCGEIGGQINLRPFASNRVGFVLRGSFGGGNIGDESLAIQDYVPVDRFTRGSVSLGLQITLAPRLRLDLLGGFVRYTTGNSAPNGSGDGARGNGLRTELAFTVDLTRPREGFRAVPYFRIGVDVQRITWDIFTTSGGHNYVNRTGVAGMIGFGLRLGSGAILAH